MHKIDAFVFREITWIMCTLLQNDPYPLTQLLLFLHAVCLTRVKISFSFIIDQKIKEKKNCEAYMNFFFPSS